MATEKRALGITLIAIGKLLKVLALIGLGVAFFYVSEHDSKRELVRWADLFRIDPQNRWLDRMIGKITGHSPHQLAEMGIGTFAYAAVFSVEGLGLWLRKRWAEWLTIAITTSFVPLEVYELVKEPGAGKIVALVLNVAAVVYLVVRRVKDIARHRHASSPGSASSTASPPPARA